MDLGSRMARALKPTTYTIRYPRKMAGNPLLYISSASASLGDALLGYSQGITAAFQVQRSFIHRIYGKNVTYKQIKHDRTGVRGLQPALLISCLSVTALFSALASAYASDFLGRRASIRIGAILYLIASAIQMIAPNLTTLIVGRSIQGLGAGILSTTVPVYQVEIAPAGARGMLVGIEALCMNAGYAASAWVGYAFYMDARAEHAWRGPFGVQATVSLVLFIWTFFLPESPRWLIQHGFYAEGLWTLADLHARGDVTDEGVTHTYDAIVRMLEMEEKGKRGNRDGDGEVAPWSALWKDYPRRTLIGLTSRMFAQLTGISTILHFLPEHLAEAGFSIPRALFLAGCCSLLYSLGTLPAILFIDKLGRRRFLIVGSIALACSLVLIGCLQLYVDHWPRMLSGLGGAQGVFIGMCMYLFVFGATWGPVPWLLSAELYPLRMRARGMSLATASDWFFECLVGVITPPLFALLNGAYYLLLAGGCVLAGLAVWLAYVETSGQSLEDIGGVFFGDPMPVPGKIEQEDAVLWVRCGRRRVRGRSIVSMPTTPVGSMAGAGSSQGTLHLYPTAAAARSSKEGSAHGSQVTLLGSPAPSTSVTPQVTLHPDSIALTSTAGSSSSLVSLAVPDTQTNFKQASSTNTGTDTGTDADMDT